MRLSRAFIWLLLCVCLSTYAESLDSLPQRFQIEEVTVTARRKETAVIPVQTLHGAQLEALSSQSVADALRYFSGVQLKDYGGVGGLKTVDMRSMGTHHLGVFYDGIEIGNAQNGTVDLGKFSMDNIEEISLYNGQKSEIFQCAKDFGSAGTLYIRTRRPKFAADKPYNVQVTMKAGTFGLASPSVLYEQRLTENIHLSANAEYTYANGRYHFRYRRVLPSGVVAWDTTAVRQNGDINAGRAELGVFGYMPDGKWHVKGYYYQSEKGIPGAIVNNVWTSSQRQWDRNAFCQGNFTHTWGNYSMMVNAKYSNDHMRYLNPDTTQMYIDNRFDQQEIYLSTTHKYDLAALISKQSEGRSTARRAFNSPKGVQPFVWNVCLSADYQYNWLASDLVNFVRPQRHTVLLAAATAMQYKWIRLQASALGTIIKDRTFSPITGLARMDTLRTSFSPAVFLSYQPYLPEQFFIRAFYKKVFRMPTFNDLYYTDIGNIRLNPERATQYDLGAQYSKYLSSGVVRQVGAKVDGYFNQIHDKIVAIPKGNGQYRWQMLNLGYVEILGVDINADITLVPVRELSITVVGTYTFQRARDLTDPSSEFYGHQIAYIPWHSGSVTGNITWRNLSLNYSFIYVGERYHQAANIPANYEQPWYTHDLSLSYFLPFHFGGTRTSLSHPWGKGATTRRDRGVSFTVEVNNLLNQQYDVILNYPMPGINGKGIVKFFF